jgi:hypothetical protein
MQPSAGNMRSDMLTMLQEYIKRDKITHSPPRPNLASRSRLTQRLDEGLRLWHKLILISALLVKRVQTEEVETDEERSISQPWQ